MADIIVHCDGSIRDGRAGWGFVVRNGDWSGPKHGKGVVPIEWGTTANVGEYYAVLSALRWLDQVESLAGKDILVYSDSQLIVYQLTGKYQVTRPHLRRLHAAVLELARKGRVSFIWVPRKFNKEADALAGQAWEKGGPDAGQEEGQEGEAQEDEGQRAEESARR